MDFVPTSSKPLSEAIRGVVTAIVELLAPNKIYLYNQRMNHLGTDSSFKLCVIVDTDDKTALEQLVYTEIDCAIPFDILLYTQQEWLEISQQTTSFASKILRTGTIVYG